MTNSDRLRAFKLSFAILTLALGTASTLGLSCAPVSSVERVIAVDGKIFAAVFNRVYGTTARNPDGLLPSPRFAQSTDGGLHWEPVSSVPDIATLALNAPLSLPVTLCDEIDSKMCFRVSGEARVDASRDGGRTWGVAWQVPPERQEYVRQLQVALAFTGCGRRISFDAVGLSLVRGATGSTPVVAMGDQGVLVSDSNGAWQQVAVLDAEPTQFESYNPFDVLELAAEFGSGVGTALILVQVLMMFSYVTALNRLREAGQSSGTSYGQTIRRSLWNLPKYAVLLLAMGGCLLVLPLLYGVYNCFIVLDLVVIAFFVWSTYDSMRGALPRMEPIRQQMKAAIVASFQTAISVLIVWWLGLYLWISGLVPRIDVAWQLLEILAAGATIIGVYRILRINHALARQPGDSA